MQSDYPKNFARAVKKSRASGVFTYAGVTFETLEDHMITLVKSFLEDEAGQDLIEYTLLLGFVALGSAALYTQAGRSAKGVWTSANSSLVAANTAAS